MRYFALKGILLVALSPIACFPAFAHTSPNKPSQKSVPMLNVTVVPSEQADLAWCNQNGAKLDSGKVLGLNLRYSGEKALRGYQIVVSQGDQPWGYSQDAFFNDLAGHETKPPDGYLIQPGAAWHTPVCGFRDADFSKTNAYVDLLIFQDGSISGPVVLRQSQILYGTLLGLIGEADEGKFVTRMPVGSDLAGEPISIDNDSLPLQFSGIIERNDSGKTSLVIKAVNNGNVAVLGYIFKISFYDHATGAFVRSVTTKAVSRNPLPPGGIWHSIGRRISVSSDGEFDTYKVSVDMLQLANGKVFGPRRSAESYEVSGMINAFGSARGTLTGGTR
jgi:hypothetical protein